MTKFLRLAVFISGSGSNLQAILDACSQADFPAKVAAVVSNSRQAYGLERANRAGVPVIILEHQKFQSRQDHEREIIRRLAPFDIGLIVLAGYLRVVTATLINRFYRSDLKLPGVINIHPADTAQYQGLHGYEFALGLLSEFPRRLSETKITVHFVDDQVDTGPIIMQSSVKIFPDDTLDRLKSRGLDEEHILYPRVIRLYAEKRLTLENNGQVIIASSILR